MAVMMMQCGYSSLKSGCFLVFVLYHSNSIAFQETNPKPICTRRIAQCDLYLQSFNP